VFGSLDTSASALAAQRIRMDTIANNLANINTTRDARGRVNPYRRKEAVFAVGSPTAPRSGEGVRVLAIKEDLSEFNKVHKPGHPDADADGYVLTPNVNLIQEIVDMIEASRAYEANVTAMQASKSLVQSSMRILV